MPTPQDPDARLYWRVAFQRFDDGRLLLERLERYHAAVYLAGYAVECILKALLLRTTPRGERPAVLATFRGPRAHNIDWLRGQVVSRGVHIPAAVAGSLVFVSSWSVDLRYEAGQGDPEDAQAFLRATQQVLSWCDQRI